MAKIGDITHLPDIKAKKCAQCGTWFYYERKSKTYCSAACRQARRRGKPLEDNNPHLLTDYEQFAAMVSVHKPTEFEHMEKLKEKYGFRAVEMCIDVIMELAD